MIDLPLTPYIIVCNHSETPAWVALWSPGITLNISQFMLVLPNGWLALARGDAKKLDTADVVTIIGSKTVPSTTFDCNSQGNGNG